MYQIQRELWKQENSVVCTISSLSWLYIHVVPTTTTTTTTTAVLTFYLCA
jgi:hypothetical protein